MPPRRKLDGPIAVASVSNPTAKVRTASPQWSVQNSDLLPKPGAATYTDKSVAGNDVSRTQQDDGRPSRGSKQDDSFTATLQPFYYQKTADAPIDTAQDKWNLLPAFLKNKGLVKQHIDSYNHFVNVELKKIIEAEPIVTSDIDPTFYIKYLNIYVGRAQRSDENIYGDSKKESTITPNECRLSDLTYSAPIFVDVQYTKGRSIYRRKALCIGRMPVMLRSNKCVLANKSEGEMYRMNECPLDPGGYFIVNGTEKVILVQEQLSKNRIIVETDTKKDSITASVTSSTHARKSKSYVVLKKDLIYAKHNILQEDIPICILLRAMGVTSDLDMMAIVAGTDVKLQDNFSVNFEETIKLGIFTQQQALDYIGQRIPISRKGGSFGQARRNYVQEALEAISNVFIAHVTIEDLNFRPKALYVAHMARRVLMAKQNPKLVDDRDYVGNKRLELAGQLLSLLFEDSFKRYNSDIKTNMDKVLRKPNKTEVADPCPMMASHASTITQSMNRAIATGNWNLKRFRMDRAGVTHLLSRLSFIASLGMMTRIQSQFEKTRKVSGPRALQASQFGMLCPADTPEGEACGLVKNLALMTHITTEDEEGPIKQLIFMLGAEDIVTVGGAELYTPGSYVILLNGTPIAHTRHPAHFLNSFRRLRRSGRVSEFVSVFINHHHSTINVATDEGRICRPLIVVTGSKSRVTKRYLTSLRQGSMDFDDFLARGLVEYLDVNEENDSNIAMYERNLSPASTHLEIEPFTILGAVAGLIPYPHHNQSPRNTYQCAMGKQAIGFIASNQFLRIDTLLYLMVYPQKPLCKTRTIELTGYDKLPAGQNAVVAVMSYSGYDIEDALVLNKGSVDRGFGRCQVLRKYPVVLKTYANGSKDTIPGPNMENGVPVSKHALLNEDGLAAVGEKVSSGEVCVNKFVPDNTQSSGLSENSSQAAGPAGTSSMRRNMLPQPLTYRLPVPSYISQVALHHNTQTGTTLLKVQTRQTRVPEVGDKFSSRHGQKGVVGIIAEQVDMPFSDTGIVPDIIMNPHGFPSRMTVGKMLELVAGKSAVLTGNFNYGTAFGGTKLEYMSKCLIEHGYSYDGKDYLTSGITGEPLPAYVFKGPIYYQKLKHMVMDKMHSRSRGPRAILTRQPTEGRSRDGGLRLGEMERDCLIAYGASQLLRERLMLSSDKHTVEVCLKCGFMCFNRTCQRCERAGEKIDSDGKSGVVKMVLPYAFRLLQAELVSMNVDTRIMVGDEFPAEGGRRG